MLIFLPRLRCRRDAGRCCPGREYATSRIFCLCIGALVRIWALAIWHGDTLSVGGVARIADGESAMSARSKALRIIHRAFMDEEP